MIECISQESSWVAPQCLQCLYLRAFVRALKFGMTRQIEGFVSTKAEKLKLLWMILQHTFSLPMTLTVSAFWLVCLIYGHLVNVSVRLGLRSILLLFSNFSSVFCGCVCVCTFFWIKFIFLPKIVHWLFYWFISHSSFIF